MFSNIELTVLGAMLPVFAIGGLVALALAYTRKPPASRREVAAIAAASGLPLILMLGMSMGMDLTEGQANLLLGGGAAATVALVGVTAARRLFSGGRAPELDQPEATSEAVPAGTPTPPGRSFLTPRTRDASPGKEPSVPTAYPAPRVWRPGVGPPKDRTSLWPTPWSIPFNR